MALSPELVKLYKRSVNDPQFYVENVIGMTTLWGKQRDILNSLRDNERTVVRSCNGAGKTFTTANALTWFLGNHVNSIVVSTAPTSRQVKDLLWQEVNNIYANSQYRLGGRCMTVNWTMGAKWFAIGLSTDDPNRFQGFHAENILGIIDEAAGVDPQIWLGMDSILTSSGAKLLAIGNPTEPSGAFYDAFSSPLYNKIHISAFDTPNFTENGITLDDIRNNTWKPKFKDMIYPALVTPKWVYDRYVDWGEDSPAFQSRIKGEFPNVAHDTMIPLGWVLRAKERPVEATTKTDRCIMAIDVARFGDDESSIGVRRKESITRREDFSQMDVHTLSKHAQRIADEENPEYIKVDVVGVGAGVADNLRAWGYRAIDYIAQGQAWEKEKFVNRRTESWYLLRERFRKNEIHGIDDELLIGQLSSPRYTFDAAGRYVLEPKEKMKKRGLSSPDRADVVAMLFESDDDYESIVIKDAEFERPKKETLEDLMKLVTGERDGDVEWQTLHLG